MKNIIKSSFLGLAIGDALGVPVEFEFREYLNENPVIDMLEYGTHNQPIGSFSDDSSLTFCTAESLINDYNIADIMSKFLDWRDNNYWTSHNRVFDVGVTTDISLDNFRKNKDPYNSGESFEKSNGNGSLMRMLPVAFYVLKFDLEKRFQIIKEISSITHKHIRSVIGCFYYTEYIRLLIEGNNKFDAYNILKKSFKHSIKELGVPVNEIMCYENLLDKYISDFDRDEIYSSGYIVYTLEAVIWTILTTNSFSEAILKAVNLGEDTDSIGAITGSIAGILYPNEIPQEWIDKLARNKDIIDLAERFTLSL